MIFIKNSVYKMRFVLKDNEDFIVDGNINNREISVNVLDAVTSESVQNLNKVPQVSGTVASTVTIDPYKLYNFGTVSQAMTIAFNIREEISGYAAEYIIRFVAGSGCSITLPNGVLYNGGTPPTYTSGRTYEIDIVNNCAAVAEFY